MLKVSATKKQTNNPFKQINRKHTRSQIGHDGLLQPLELHLERQPRLLLLIDLADQVQELHLQLPHLLIVLTPERDQLHPQTLILRSRLRQLLLQLAHFLLQPVNTVTKHGTRHRRVMPFK